MIDTRAGRAVLSRRDLMKLGAALAVAPVVATAQTYPSRPIRIITGFPGGSIDMTARLIANALSEILGSPVIVETKAGASGLIASEYVAKAAGDGYTLLVATPSQLLVAPQVIEKATFDPLVDIRGINAMSKAPFGILVNPRLNITRMKELVALSHTRAVTMGTNGLGTSLHVLVESLNEAYKASFRVIPYRSSSQSAVDVLAGHIDAAVSDVGALIPFHNDRRAVLVGVTGSRRLEVLPDVAAVEEDVPGFTMENWMGVFAPGTLSPGLAETINAALVKALARADVQTQFQKMAVSLAVMPNPAEFQKFVKLEYERFGKVIKDKKIVAN